MGRKRIRDAEACSDVKCARGTVFCFQIRGLSPYLLSQCNEVQLSRVLCLERLLTPVFKAEIRVSLSLGRLMKVSETAQEVARIGGSPGVLHLSRLDGQTSHTPKSGWDSQLCQPMVTCWHLWLTEDLSDNRAWQGPSGRNLALLKEVPKAFVTGFLHTVCGASQWR